VADVKYSSSEYLEIWKTPFTEAAFPAVAPIFPPDNPKSSTKDRFQFKVVLMPRGLGKYPGYVIDFVRAHAVLSYDESCATNPNSHWAELVRNAPRSCAYVWHGSSLLRQYNGIGCEFEDELKHYVILGGDSIVEVLTYEAPTVTSFDGPQIFTIQHSF